MVFRRRTDDQLVEDFRAHVVFLLVLMQLLSQARQDGLVGQLALQHSLEEFMLRQSLALHKKILKFDCILLHQGSVIKLRISKAMITKRATAYLPPWVLVSVTLALGAIYLLNMINAKLDADIFHQPQGQIKETPDQLGLPYEDVTYQTADDLWLRGWFIPGTSDAGIVMAPGYTDTRWNVLKYAPFLHEAGYNLLLFDPRGEGQSDGTLYAFGAFEPEDIEAGITYLREKRGIKQIALFGHSNGGTVTLIAASRHPYPEVFAVVVDSPFANLKLASESPKNRDPLLEALFPLYTAVAQMRLGFDLFERTNALRVVGRVSHVFFIHGTADTSVTPENSELLEERAEEPKALWLVEGAEHVKSFDADPTRYAERVLSFLKQFQSLATEEER
jgi:pimeloyl-ACP methyl ester carboxylesterase